MPTDRLGVTLSETHKLLLFVYLLYQSIQLLVHFYYACLLLRDNALVVLASVISTQVHNLQTSSELHQLQLLVFLKVSEVMQHGKIMHQKSKPEKTCKGSTQLHIQDVIFKCTLVNPIIQNYTILWDTICCNWISVELKGLIN